MAKLEISKVHDAYAAGGECPLCTLMDGVERTYLLSFQGSRVMEPNVRVQTNRLGFCPEHSRRLYRGENKLGLSLVVHTHLTEKLPELKRRMEDALQPGDRRKGREKAAEPLDSLLDYLESLRKGCFICDMLAADLKRYAFTIVYLWKGDAEFLPTFRASRGFCIGHLPPVIEQARRMLRERELEGFLKDIVPLMTGSLEKLERELFEFTQLFHDANRTLGSEEIRTALARTLQKLAGSVMRQD
jgi:hypothetical protein